MWRQTQTSTEVVVLDMGHKEVCVKVNAWVDEGVAPLVQALNQFLHVRTQQSCEGPAEVTFTYGEETGLPCGMAIRFALWLTDEFAVRGEEQAALRVVCLPHRRFLLGLQVDPEAVDRIAAELRAMAHRFRDDLLPESGFVQAEV